MSMLKSEETTLLENIAVNYEKLNNTLTKSLTPCLSGRIQNQTFGRTQGATGSVGLQATGLSRTQGITTPLAPDEKEIHSFMGESHENQFGSTQPIYSNNTFNIRNVTREFKKSNRNGQARNLRKAFNSTYQSTGTAASPPDEAMMLSLQPSSKSGYFKLSGRNGPRMVGGQGRSAPYQLDMSAHIANCKQIRKNFIEKGIMDYDVNQISNLNFENQLSQKNLQQNITFNVQKSLSQVRQLIKRRQQSAKPGSNMANSGFSNKQFEQIRLISKNLEMSNGVLSTSQLEQMNLCIDLVCQDKI